MVLLLFVVCQVTSSTTARWTCVLVIRISKETCTVVPHIFVQRVKFSPLKTTSQIAIRMLMAWTIRTIDKILLIRSIDMPAIIIIHRFFDNRSTVDVKTTRLWKIDSPLFFWRTLACVNIDVVIDIDRRIHPFLGWTTVHYMIFVDKRNTSHLHQLGTWRIYQLWRLFRWWI